MASVQKRGNKWYAIFKNQYGLWSQKSGYSDKAMTMRLAQKLEDENKRILSGDLDPAAEQARIQRSKPVESHINQYESHLQSHRRHKYYIQGNILDIRYFFEFSKLTHASAVTIPMVDAWRNHCLTVGYKKKAHSINPTPDSIKTVNRRITSLKMFLNFLVSFGGVERNVLIAYKMLNSVGHETFHRRSLTESEVELLLSKTPDEKRKMIYQFALQTGFRLSEIESMTPSNFDFKNKLIRINAIQSKRKTENQIIPIHNELFAPLRNACKGLNPDDKVFKFGRKNNIVPLLRADCAACGIDTTDIDFHALRHTFCSLLAETGIRPEVLSKLARHKQISTTMRYYVHVRPESEAEALNKL
ncbi:MAG: tyrosine-type recombinase/integrase [Phycisphaerae bacterium]